MSKGVKSPGRNGAKARRVSCPPIIEPGPRNEIESDEENETDEEIDLSVECLIEAERQSKIEDRADTGERNRSNL